MEKPKKVYERRRTKQLLIMVSDEERELINVRMKDAEIGSIRAYLLKMALNGRIIRVEMDSVREMVRLLANATNNINQIARRVNETGNIYKADINDIQVRQRELWDQVNEVLERLSGLN